MVHGVFLKDGQERRCCTQNNNHLAVNKKHSVYSHPLGRNRDHPPLVVRSGGKLPAENSISIDNQFWYFEQLNSLIVKRRLRLQQ